MLANLILFYCGIPHIPAFCYVVAVSDLDNCGIRQSICWVRSWVDPPPTPLTWEEQASCLSLVQSVCCHLSLRAFEVPLSLQTYLNALFRISLSSYVFYATINMVRSALPLQ